MTWAHWAEPDNQSNQPVYLDEFYKVASPLWINCKPNQASFFTSEGSMLTLAAQCGLHHYLDAKLSQDNTAATQICRRSLLDYALVPAQDSEMFVSVDVIKILLKHGASPNRNEHNGDTSPWENALSYVDADISNINPDDHRNYILERWAPIIELLLDSGVNPHAGALRPLKRVRTDHIVIDSERIWSIDEVLVKAFASQPHHLGQLQIELYRMREPQRNNPSQSFLRYLQHTLWCLP